MRSAMLSACSVAAISLFACADQRLLPSDALTISRQIVTAELNAPFTCDVEFTTVSTYSDDDLASYGVPMVVDTSRVCSSWTGSDYRVHVVQLGSSEAQGDAPDSLRTVTLDGGVVSASDASGAEAAPPSVVASTAFDLGQATANEEAASYAEPFYGVTSSAGSGGSGGNECMQDCSAMLRAGPSDHAQKAQKKEHGVKNVAIKALLGDKDEIERGPKGHRRFRSIQGDEEQTIEIDPATELITAHETRSNHGRVTKAKLTWEKKQGGRFVRELMEIDHTEYVKGVSHHSRATVRILDLKVGGNK